MLAYLFDGAEVQIASNATWTKLTYLKGTKMIGALIVSDSERNWRWEIQDSYSKNSCNCEVLRLQQRGVEPSGVDDEWAVFRPDNRPYIVLKVRYRRVRIAVLVARSDMNGLLEVKSVVGKLPLEVLKELAQKAQEALRDSPGNQENFQALKDFGLGEL